MTATAPTNTDRDLLAAALRWAITNRWTHGWNLAGPGWANPDHTLRISWDPEQLHIWRRHNNRWPTHPVTYRVLTVQGAVDILAGADWQVLPARFSSAYTAGREAA